MVSNADIAEKGHLWMGTSLEEREWKTIARKGSE